MQWINSFLNTVLSQAKQIKKQKQFGWLIFSIVLLIASYNCYENHNTYVALYLFLICLLFVFVNYTLPIVYYIPLIIWLTIGKTIGEITSSLVLFIVYYLFFSPITLIKRLFTKSSLKSGWIKRENKKINYKNQF